jgi:hypothetical protein
METLYLMLAVLLGVVYRLYTKWAIDVKAERPFRLKLAMVAAIGSVLANFILVIFREDVSAFLPITYLTACIYGYFGDSVLRGITKKVKPDFNK